VEIVRAVCLANALVEPLSPRRGHLVKKPTAFSTAQGVEGSLIWIAGFHGVHSFEIISNAIEEELKAAFMGEVGFHAALLLDFI